MCFFFLFSVLIILCVCTDPHSAFFSAIFFSVFFSLLTSSPPHIVADILLICALSVILQSLSHYYLCISQFPLSLLPNSHTISTLEINLFLLLNVLLVRHLPLHRKYTRTLDQIPQRKRMKEMKERARRERRVRMKRSVRRRRRG